MSSKQSSSTSPAILTTTGTLKVSRRTLTAPIPVQAVIQALENELRSEKNGPGVFAAAAREILSRSVQRDDRTANQKRQTKEFESVVQNHLGELGFMLFDKLNHSWYSLYRHHDASPKTIVRYIYGNPLLARTMMKHTFVAGLHVPTNLLVIGDERSTTIIYDVPSSLIAAENSAVPFSAQTESEGMEALEKNALALDAKVDTLIRATFSRAAEAVKAKL
jgi:uncharacterized protein (DUF302 family)